MKNLSFSVVVSWGCLMSVSCITVYNRLSNSKRNDFNIKVTTSKTTTESLVPYKNMYGTPAVTTWKPTGFMLRNHVKPLKKPISSSKKRPSTPTYSKSYSKIHKSGSHKPNQISSRRNDTILHDPIPAPATTINDDQNLLSIHEHPFPSVDEPESEISTVKAENDTAEDDHPNFSYDGLDDDNMPASSQSNKRIQCQFVTFGAQTGPKGVYAWHASYPIQRSDGTLAENNARIRMYQMGNY